MIKYLWNGCFLWLIILLNTSCSPPNDQTPQNKEQGKYLEGWWELVANEEQQETDLFLNQLFSGTEPNLIQIQANKIEFPQGITLDNTHHGHFINCQLEEKKIHLQHPVNQSMHQYRLKKDGEQVTWVNQEDKIVLVAKKYTSNEEPDSTFNMQYLSLNIPNTLSVNTANQPVDLFIEIYNNRSLNIQYKYPENPASNTNKRGKLTKEDYAYLLTLMKRIDWAKVANQYASNANDSTKIGLFIQSKQLKRKLVIGNKEELPYPFQWFLNYLEKGTTNWELEMIQRG